MHVFGTGAAANERATPRNSGILPWVRSWVRDSRRRSFAAAAIVATVLGATACSLIDLSDLSAGPFPRWRDGGNDATGFTPDDGETPSPTDADADAGVPHFVPSAGNYRYVQNTSAYADANAFPNAPGGTFGSDRLTTHGSLGAIKYARSQASTMSASVEALVSSSSEDGACWKWSLRVHPTDAEGQRDDEEYFCARDGGLFANTPKSSAQVQNWPSAPIQWSATTMCDRSTTYLTADAALGDRWDQRCAGTMTIPGQTGVPSYDSNGSVEYLDRASVTVGDTQEEAHWIRRDRTLKNDRIDGREVVEFFLSTRDGLPLRIHRYTRMKIVLTGILGVDDTTFDEDGSDWVLEARPSAPDGGVADGGEADASGADASEVDAGD